MSESNRHYNDRKKSTERPIEQVVFEGIFKGLWWLITLPFHKGKGGAKSITTADKEAFQGYWGQVDYCLLQSNQLLNALMEADKILDQALIRKGAEGNTLGERLKYAEKFFNADLYQEIWRAHKLRNTLAHEVGAEINEKEIKYSVATIKKAITYLGLL